LNRERAATTEDYSVVRREAKLAWLDGKKPRIVGSRKKPLTPIGEVQLDVRLQRETVWLSLDQIAKLLGRDKP
jgi:hypothetical protein